MAAKVADDWEVLETSCQRGRAGMFVGISPLGGVFFSWDLEKLLDPKLPRCTLQYSASRRVLRIVLQRKITAHSYQWKQAGSQGYYFSAESALRTKGLVPKIMAVHTATFIPPEQNRPPMIEVDVSCRWV